MPSATNKGQCEHLLSSLNDHALTQVQKKPTGDKNILALCITNKPGLIKSSRSIGLLGILDHCAVLTEAILNPPYRCSTRGVPRIGIRGGGVPKRNIVMIVVGIQIFFNWHQIVTFSATEFLNVHVVMWVVKLLKNKLIFFLKNLK